MIKQIKILESNALAFEITGGFTEADEKLAQKLFKEKLDLGYKKVNILMKVDGYIISQTEFKAFFEDIIFVIRKFKNLGNLAIVGHSKILKTLVPIDNLFFQSLKSGEKEQYFDVSQLDEAFKFVTMNQ
ncbi:MAG: Uncharacterised protein [Flavobacterium sp. SCGC AAA160-P02]|nr:MAG: Uncharacterised protein [Flavobacterium sp. SCGC AAA160-P02]